MSRLARPAGERGGWLVIVERHGLPRFVFVLGEDVHEDRSAALAILADAGARGGPAHSRVPEPDRPDAEPEVERPDAEAAIRSAAEYLERQRTSPGPAADLAGRVARDLVERLRRVPGGADTAECRRADGLLERLRQGLGRGAELALEATLYGRGCPRAGPDACAVFMDRLEAVLAAGPPRPSADAQAGDRLLAMFRLVPATELVLELVPGR